MSKMKHGPKPPRGGSSVGMKGRNSKADQENLLLARGISARYCGANTALTSLSAEDIEKDLRHMEAYSNACTTYAQQFYRFQKETRGGAGGSGEKEAAKPAVQPLIAMPVRIDPEEEKRLINLRQKIQQCEAQREVLESEYLSLRAHYVYLSQRLKTCRTEVNDRVTFLQTQVQKRGKLIALQRVRLQIAREAFAALNYRLSAEVEGGDKTSGNNNNAAAADTTPAADLVDLWVQVEDQCKKAEQACRSDGIQKWSALEIPPIPPGIPLLLSPLAKGPGNAAAWSASGMFGSKPDSLVWLENLLPAEVPTRRNRELPALREESALLQRELDRERLLNKDLQGTIIKRRKNNDELIAMMTLLRTETEAVIARHNILLDSEIARDAAERLVDEEELQKEKLKNGVGLNNSSGAGLSSTAAAADGVNKSSIAATSTDIGKDASIGEAGVVTQMNGNKASTSQTTSSSLSNNNIPSTNATKVDDNANDGDDEGEIGDEDDDEEGEIVEEEGQVGGGDGVNNSTNSSGKRSFEEQQQDENGGNSPLRDRAKRRKL